MQTISHQIRLAALLCGGLLVAHLRADAQVRAFSFSERGRLFITSPGIYLMSGSAERQMALDAEQGAGKFLIPSAQQVGATISGQYFFHGVALGYQLTAGASSKKVTSMAGSVYNYETRDYTGDLCANLGFVALRMGNLRLIPSYGLGYGVWATHLYSEAKPDGTPAGLTLDNQEASMWTGHIVHDASTQLMYILPALDGGGSRFSFGLRTGLKTFASTNKAQTVLGPIQGNYGAIGMRGFYAQVSLGVGILR